MVVPTYRTSYRIFAYLAVLGVVSSLAHAEDCKARLWEYRSSGRHNDALGYLRGLALAPEELSADELEWAQWQSTTLRHIGELGDEERRQLMEADAALAIAGRHLRRRSFTEAHSVAKSRRLTYERLFGLYHPDTAEAYFLEANTLMGLGEPAQARKQTVKAATVMDSVYSNVSPERLRIESALARFSYDDGFFSDARRRYLTVINFAQQFQSHDDLLVSAWSGLGMSDFALGYTGKAILEVAESVRLRKQHYSRTGDIPYYTAGLEQLAGLEGELHNKEEYRRLTKMILDLRLRYSETNPMYVAHSRVLYGRALLAMSEFEMAIEQAEEALRTTENQHQLHSRTRADALGLHSDASVSLGRLEGALRTRAEQVSILDDTLNEPQSHGLYGNALSKLGSILLEIGRVQEAIEVLENAYRATQDAKLRLSTGTHRAAGSLEAALLLSLALLETHDGDAAWNALDQSLGRSVLGDKSPPRAKADALQWVQDALRTDSAIIGWLDHRDLWGTTESWIYVLRDTGKVWWQELDTSMDHPDFLHQFGTAMEKGVRSEWQELGSLLWKSRFAPALDKLEGVKQLVVIPGSTWTPIEAFMDVNGAYLGDLYSVSYAHSARAYAYSQQLTTRGSSSALFVIDPTFSSPSTVPANPQHSSKNDTVVNGHMEQVFANGRTSREGLTRIVRMTANLQEFSEAFDEFDALTRKNASECELAYRLCDGRMRNYRVIHFDTHGFSRLLFPMTSSLILAAADSTCELRETRLMLDGYLSAWEIAEEWDLRADLVVLGACETGLGLQTPADGFIGLTTAFLGAGARSVLVSMWPVHDEAAHILLTEFYRHYLRSDRQSASNSLRIARSRLREWGGGKRFDHPYYWSAFVLIGSD